MLVTCNRVEGIEFDYDSGRYYKIYKEKPDVLPLSLVMRKRDPKHPLNALSIRVSEKPEREIVKGQQAVCLSLDKFGLIGTVDRIDARKGAITMTFDVQSEQSKVHDPFLGQKLIKELRSGENKIMIRSSQFFGDFDIEK